VSIKWVKTAHRGLRYYEHPNRKHGKKRDRYYAIRFKVDGKEHSYGIGWLSDGVPNEIGKENHDIGFEEYCLMLLRQYKGNLKAGSGPQSPKENRKIAKANLEQATAEREQLEKDAVTFDSFFTDNYLPQAENNKKTRTVTREKGLYNVWIKNSMGRLPMKDIAHWHLERLKKDMKDGEQSPRSIEYALAIVRQVFNVAKKMKVFTGENPTADVDAPKVDNGRMRFLTRDEADKLLNLLKTKSADVHDMTLLSLHVGLRFGEIASLTWADVDIEKKVLTIRDAKAGSRYAFLTEQAADIFRNRPQEKLSDYVFQGRNGKLDRISPTFFRAVDELKLNDGIDDPRLQICFHSCRHSYASWMIEQGTDLYTVQKLLGHKTNVMTQRYAHLSENRLRDAAAALGASWQKDLRPEQAISLVK
jgi:integrase